MTENNLYHKADYCEYLTQYHVIWCPKFQYSVLNDDRQKHLKLILTDICKTYHYTIKAMEIMPDHIHIFVDVPQTVALCDIARTLKSISAVRMLHDDPELRRFYQRCGVLWSRGYFISSIGHISESTVRKYIEEHKTR